MKKYLISFIFTLITVASMNAQKTPGYVPLASFNKDTLQYLITNFENQKTKYIGKPIGMIFYDLELKITGKRRLRPSTRDKRYLAGIILEFYNQSLYNTLSLEKKRVFFKDMKDYAIYVETEQVLKSSDFDMFLVKYGLKWADEMSVFYSPYIVKSISVNGIR